MEASLFDCFLRLSRYFSTLVRREKGSAPIGDRFGASELIQIFKPPPFF
jgi:hypothetical protein